MKRFSSFLALFLLLLLPADAQYAVRLFTNDGSRAAFPTSEVDCISPREGQLEVLLHNGQKLLLPIEEVDSLFCIEESKLKGIERLPFCLPANAQVAVWAVFNGYFPEEKDYMDLHYYQTLLDGGDGMTLCLPSDEAMNYYYDTSTLVTSAPRMVRCFYKDPNFVPSTECFVYDFRSGQVGRRLTGSKATMQSSETVSRLKELLESSTILLDGQELEDSQNEYFLAKNGTPVRVERDGENHIVALYGGFQMENNRVGISQPEQKGVNVCRVTSQQKHFPGHPAYLLDAPLLPTYRTVYSLLNPNEEYFSPTDVYKAFFELCQTDKEVLQACGLSDSQIFTEGVFDYMVTFLEPRDYTLFVPTNEAVEQAVAEGLPTWKSIRSRYDEALTKGLQEEDISVIKKQIETLLSFVRSHFVVRSVFADRTPMPETVLQTCASEEETVRVWREEKDGEMQLFVAGENTCRVVGEKNVPARDLRLTKRAVMTTVLLYFPQESPSIVVHQIDGTLFRF